MAYIEARQFTTGADMIAAARNVRDRLFRKSNIVDYGFGNPTKAKPKPVVPVIINETVNGRPLSSRKKSAYFEMSAREYIMKRCGELMIPYSIISETPRTPAMREKKYALVVETYVKFDTLSLEAVGDLFHMLSPTVSKVIKAHGVQVREKPRTIVSQAMMQKEYMQTGHKGISVRPKDGKYRARLAVGLKTYTIGHYSTLDEAVAARHERMVKFGRTPN